MRKPVRTAQPREVHRSEAAAPTLARGDETPMTKTSTPELATDQDAVQMELPAPRGGPSDTATCLAGGCGRQYLVEWTGLSRMPH